MPRAARVLAASAALALALTMRKPEQKCYVPDVGEIVERVVNGHHEAFELVSVTH
jgi:hypothetical protein